MMRSPRRRRSGARAETARDGSPGAATSARALVCAPLMPEFDRESGSSRLYAFIRFLRDAAWDVTFVSRHSIGPPDRYVRLLKDAGVAALPAQGDDITDLVRRERFDLAFLAFWQIGELYMPALRRLSPGTKIIVDSVDLHFVRNARQMLMAPSNGSQPRLLDASLGADFVRELNVYAAADGVLTVSRTEADHVNTLLGDQANATVVPDFEDLPRCRRPFRARRGLLFIGNFRHAPNVDALRYLIREILPRLPQDLLDTHPLYVVGNAVDDEVRRTVAGLRGVHLVGWVPSLLPYLEHVRVAMVPLRYGAGTKRKLIQSLMTGLPSVSTTVGVEGLDLRDGHHVLTADDPDRFAAAVARLVNDEALWRRLASASHAHVTARHGRHVARHAFFAALDSVLTTTRTSPRLPEAAAAHPSYQSAYGELVERVRTAVDSTLPEDSRVLIVSKGDDMLLDLGHRHGGHFPQDPSGAYAGHYPRDSAEAIAHLEALRAKGAQYLAVPATSAWWLDHYQEFRSHLEQHYRVVCARAETCVIFALNVGPGDAQGPDTENSSHHVSGAAPRTQGPPLSADNGDIRLIAFYLPQFYPTPETDTRFGEGFTDWNLVAKARPRFPGHYQPHVPGDLGFYDLRLAETREHQAQLARQHGIHGFCYFHYWLDGRSFFGRPFSQVLESGKPDFPFCLCWINQAWPRPTLGGADDLSSFQTPAAADDIVPIQALLPAFLDRRAITVDGKPLFLVFQPAHLRDPVRTADAWRAAAAKAGLPGLYLIAVQTQETGIDHDATATGFDATTIFQPHVDALRTSAPAGARLLLPEAEHLEVYNYEKAMLALAAAGKPVPQRRYQTVIPGWDTSPRLGDSALVLQDSTPHAYDAWLRAAVADAGAYPPAERLIFINAWNDWASGCHLEPDLQFGRAYLEATRRALTEGVQTALSIQSSPGAFPAIANGWTILFVSHSAYPAGAQLVLLNLLTWLKRHTSIRFKILCLDGGQWLSRFRGLGDTVLWKDLQPTDAPATSRDLDASLHAFLGATPDLIYVNSLASGPLYQALSRVGAPILTHVHELETSIARYAGPSIKDILAHSTHYLACSDAVADNLVHRHRVPRTKIDTVHSSIAPDPVVEPKGDHDRAALRNSLGLVPEKSMIVGCGVGTPFRKGADLFIELAERLRRAGRDDFHCYWVGDFDGHEQDPHLGVWADHLAALRTTAVTPVTFLGVKDNPRAYLQAADVFVLPSREDPFPLAALEAAECGLPIVCFAGAGGMPAFVSDDAGCVVPFEDVPAMAREVSALIDDPPRRHRLGSSARHKLLARFTTEFTTPHILSVSRRVARKRPTVSVIVPNYNHARYLPERLSSIFSQTYRDFEVILLDDASSDHSLELLERFRDHADVHIVRSRRNSGSPFRQWLKGLDRARADIVWIAESDDRCDPTFLEALLPAFNHPHVRFAYANSHIIDESGSVVGDYTTNEYLTSLSATKWSTPYRCSAEQEINDGLGVKNTILNVSAALFRKTELAPDVRRTLATMHIAGDWYFNIHAIAGGEIAYIPSKLNYHRRHSESVIGRLLRQKRVAEFFREFYVVQNAVFANYHLDVDFVGKWEFHLRYLWTAFFPNRPFEGIEAWYPLDRARAQIAISSRRLPTPTTAGPRSRGRTVLRRQLPALAGALKGPGQ